MLLRIGTILLALQCTHPLLAQPLDGAKLPQQPEQFHVFLLIGQSNMAGRGEVAAEDQTPHPRVFALTEDDTWQPAVDPLHFDKPAVIGVGPGRSFALDYARAHPDVSVGLVPCAAGGSPIDSWLPGGYHDQTKSHPYDDAMRRARVALQSGVLKGFLWHQGESDSKAELAEAYSQKLIDLIYRLRDELDAPDAPFLIGQMGQFDERPWDEYRTQVDQAQQAIVRQVPATAFASSAGLEHKGDLVHFDAASARELGHRYYRAYASLPKLERVSRIWDHARHNAFTDLLRFQDKWFCVFREGEKHVSPDGALRIISSSDGQTWESAALITDATADLRDAKLTTMPDGQLMLSGAGAMHDDSQFRHQSMSWFSADGSTWSAAHPIGERDFWLWRTTWHAGQAYSVGYQTNTSENNRLVRLYSSRDGKDFQPLVPNLVDQGYPNETSMVFLDDGTCHCLLRRDGETKTGLLGTASPPYTQWQWKDLGVRIGGPHMLRIPDGRFVAAVRLYDRQVRTALCWLDVETGQLTEFLSLPSGGDTSYPGLVWNNGRLWVSYYSSHEAQGNPFTSAIYLAEVQIP